VVVPGDLHHSGGRQHFFRSDGDKFVVLATDCNGPAALEMAEDLQTLASQLELTKNQEHVPTSITTGISTLQGNELKPDALLASSVADLRQARRKAES
jgi:GGDEF domain-containing protein